MFLPPIGSPPATVYQLHQASARTGSASTWASALVRACNASERTKARIRASAWTESLPVATCNASEQRFPSACTSALLVRSPPCLLPVPPDLLHRAMRANEQSAASPLFVRGQPGLTTPRPCWQAITTLLPHLSRRTAHTSAFGGAGCCDITAARTFLGGGYAAQVVGADVAIRATHRYRASLPRRIGSEVGGASIGKRPKQAMIKVMRLDDQSADATSPCQWSHKTTIMEAFPFDEQSTIVCRQDIDHAMIDQAISGIIRQQERWVRELINRSSKPLPSLTKPVNVLDVYMVQLPTLHRRDNERREAGVLVNVEPPSSKIEAVKRQQSVAPSIGHACDQEKQGCVNIHTASPIRAGS